MVFAGYWFCAFMKNNHLIGTTVIVLLFLTIGILRATCPVPVTENNNPQNPTAGEGRPKPTPTPKAPKK